MPEVAVVAFAQSQHCRRESRLNEVEMLMPVLAEARESIGIEQQSIGFTCSGSSDYLAGQAFSFVMTLDGVGAWPPIRESHVEMDGAWALYEAWVKLKTGEVDTALVYAYSKSSPGQLRDVLSRQLEPFCSAPLWPDSVSLAALQARTLLDSGRASEKDFAEIAVDNRRRAKDNPFAQLAGDFAVESLLKQPYLVSPLRKHDCPPISDGVAAVILAADDRARRLCERPAWIRGIDHRIDAHALGLRDLTRAPSLARAAVEAGVAADRLDIAELHAPFSAQELVVRDELGLSARTVINPSGGALAANPMMAAGLIRIGESAQRISRGQADRAVATATAGHCLQHNLVCVLEGE